jgi:hypothetical protein
MIIEVVSPVVVSEEVEIVEISVVDFPPEEDLALPEVANEMTEAPGKCLKLLVLTAEKIVKFHLDQQTANQYIALTVLKKCPTPLHIMELRGTGVMIGLILGLRFNPKHNQLCQIMRN